MYYDTLTLSAVADELRASVLHGRVQRIVRPDAMTLGIEIYAGTRYQLVLSAEPSAPRVHLSDMKLRRGTEARSPLQLLLAKYVMGARLESISQPPLERVLWLQFNGEHGPVQLIAEIMGRYSNVVLVDTAGIVMDAMKRIPPSINRFRSTLPQQPYVLPPSQHKQNPLRLTPEALSAALGHASGEPLWKRLVESFVGISPLLARGIVFRASGNVAQPAPVYDNWPKLLATMCELLTLPETKRWAPCIAFQEGEPGAPTMYAAYELTHYALRQPVGSISAAIQRVLEAKALQDPYKQARERLRQLAQREIDRQRARIASLQRSPSTPEEAEAVRMRANAILAMTWSIQPGQSELVLDASMAANLMNNEGPVRIPLDPSLSPADNAAKLFQTYHKIHAASREVPQRIAEAERELAYIQHILTDIDLAENRSQLDEIEEGLCVSGCLRERGGSKPRATRKSEPLTVSARDGLQILVGRNSRQNDEVTFRRATPDDLWLHARGAPGAHVVIRSGGRPVSEETLALAARLAAYYSARREESRVQVDYTARRYVRRIPGGRPGMVTYREEQTLNVAPRPANTTSDE